MMKISSSYGAMMKRIALLAVCTAALGAAPMLAQDPGTPPPPPPGGGQGGGMRGGGMGGERQLEMMTKQLNLTPDQVTSIKAIQADGMKQQMALRDDTSIAGPDKRAKMMSLREAEQGKIKALLTDDQKTKYDAMIKQMMERRQNGGGPGGPPPPPPPSN